MILVIGGAYQGKLRFAQSLYKERYDTKRKPVITDLSEAVSSDGKADIIYHVEKYIKDLTDKEKNVSEEISKLMDSVGDGILICDEVGSGIVPLDRSERTYREELGQAMQIAAKEADEVYRVYCGIGERIK